MSSKRGYQLRRCLAFCLLSILMPAWAQGTLVSEMKAFVVTTQDDGTETLQEASSVEPGQLIEYQMQYRNNGDDPLSGLAVTGPVPGGTQYVGGTAASETAHVFEASIDGGSSWHIEPLVRTVIQPDGTEKQEVVAPEEYTHVRWLAAEPLASDASQQYRYRVQVQASEEGAR